MRALLIILFLHQATSFESNLNCTSQNNYFDTSLMQCVSCQGNKVPSSDGLSCICSPGYAKTLATRDFSVFTCEKCGTSSVPSSDQYMCQACPASIDSSKNECICNFAANEVILEFEPNGDYKKTKQCFACDANTYPGSYSYNCEACPSSVMIRSSDARCTCPAQSTISVDTCVPNTFTSSTLTVAQSLENAAAVIYYNQEGPTGTNQAYSLNPSVLIMYYYLKEAYNCIDQQYIQGCQALANMCVLQLYYEKSVICELYISTTKSRPRPGALDSGWGMNMPWIYYDRSAKSVLEAGDIAMKVTFDSGDSSKVNLMQFKLAEFEVDGSFLGYSDLTDQLILCPHSLEDSKNYRKFGTNLNIACSLDLSQYLTAKKTTFFELYFIDQDGTMKDVPLLIENYIKSDGSSPNKAQDSSGWKLTRRFFLYDNISGTKLGSYLDFNTPEIIQYLQKAEVRFTLRSDKEQMIYTPYLYLKYKSRTTDYISTVSSKDSISFKSTYGMDTSKFWEIAQGIFIGMNVLVFLCWVVRLYVWTKINPQKDSPTTYTRWVILTGIRMLITTWGFIMFWYLFGLTGYWFIFYKMQYHVYALIPPLSTYSTNYYPFEVVLGLVIACCVFNAFYQIYHQADLDLILIDWEKPNRDPLAVSNIKETTGESPVYKEYVSAWRYLFIVNELNELQSQRYNILEFTLLLFVFFLDGLGWDELSRSQPNVDVGSTTSTSPKNPVLRYFLTCSLLLIIGYVQYVIRKVLSNFIATPVQNFIDLCSVSNISVMVLDEFLHGYYIHGVSPNGFAEQGLDELLESLNKEAAGKSRPRGIMPEDKSGLQSFEIFIPTAIRKTYNYLARQPVESDINVYKEGLKEASGLPRVPEALPENMSIQRVQEIRLELNRRLKIYIAGLVKDSRTQILDKSAWQRFLRMPPVDLSTLDGTPYFYRDPSIGFESSFLMGKEFSFLLMDIMLFEMFDFTIQNTYVAILLTYIVSKTVSYVRQVLGEWNLSRKALVNKRFLL